MFVSPSIEVQLEQVSSAVARQRPGTVGTGGIDRRGNRGFLLDGQARAGDGRELPGGVCKLRGREQAHDTDADRVRCRE
jgi:hypothetical protein